MESKKRFLINAIFYFVVFFLIYAASTVALKSAMPIIISLIVAISVQKPAKKLSKTLHIKSEIVAAILGITVYIIIALLIFLIVFYLVSASKNIADGISSYTDEISVFLKAAKQKISKIFSGISPKFTQKAEEYISTAAEDLLKKAGSYVTTGLTAFAAGAPTLIFNVIISLVACSYIAKDYHRLTKFFRGLCGEKIYKNAIRIKGILQDSVLKIFKGYFKLAAITFAFLCLALTLMGIKYSVLLALVISFIDLLPVLGTGIVLIPWAAIELIMGNVTAGIVLVLVYVAITLIRNFLEPRIIAGQLGIHPLFMLLAIFLGLKVFGFLGLFIVPVALVVIYEYYKEPADN